MLCTCMYMAYANACLCLRAYSIMRIHAAPTLCLCTCVHSHARKSALEKHSLYCYSDAAAFPEHEVDVHGMSGPVPSMRPVLPQQTPVGRGPTDPFL